MSYRDDLRTIVLSDGRRLIGGSFRGVPFFVESREFASGRRIAVHEFPFRDDPAVEDLGRSSREISFAAYVVGPDYVSQRNALLDAAESFGPGELVDPYRSRTIQANCRVIGIRESKASGGMAEIRLAFVEVAAGPVAPEIEPDLDAAVVTSADAGQSAVLDQLEADYDASVSVAPAFAIESLAVDVQNLTEELGARLRPLATTVQELAALDVQVKKIASDARALVREPIDLVDALFAVLESLAETITSEPRNVMLALIAAYDVPRQLPAIGDTPQRERERANQDALGGALRQLFLVEAARLLAAIDFVVESEAVADRDLVIARLDAELEIAGDPLYLSLLRLRADVARAVPGNRRLAEVDTVTRPLALPAILLSYQLYATASREEEILGRNPIRHPGFVSGTLSVLSGV